MIENGILAVQWNGGDGSAEIYLPNFFPTTAANTRKLVKKVILLDWRNQELIDDLIRYLTEKRSELTDDDLRGYANKYAWEEDKVKELTEQLKKARARLEVLKDRRRETFYPLGRQTLSSIVTEQKAVVQQINFKLKMHRSYMADFKKFFQEEKRAMKNYEADIAVLKEFQRLRK